MPLDDGALASVVDEVVAPNATSVDQQGTFPRQAVTELGKAGILGLLSSAEVGGPGGDLRSASRVVERLAGACGSTAMVVMMHYAATSVIEAHGPEGVRREIAAGRHLSTLAFSEEGSRSHFWVPMGTAVADGADVRLDGRKSWVTSAGQADSYVWSSRPLGPQGPMTLWLVPSATDGLQPPGAFDGLGLRGNGSSPVAGEGVVVPAAAMLGADGGGLDVALGVVLPVFLVLSASFSVGLMEAVVAEAASHLGSARLEHLGQRLIEVPAARADLGRMRVRTDMARALLDDTLATLEGGRADAALRVLEVKAAAAEASIEVTDLALKVCGGAAFRKELGIERRFRDARAARVMAPTSDVLVDFVGRAISGLPLLEG